MPWVTRPILGVQGHLGQRSRGRNPHRRIARIIVHVLLAFGRTSRPSCHILARSGPWVTFDGKVARWVVGPETILGGAQPEPKACTYVWHTYWDPMALYKVEQGWVDVCLARPR
jgi:hypothetical protein